MTPSKVKEKRRQEATGQMEEMERQVSTTVDLFDRVAQLWTTMEEDE
jgi:hypothetical protein